MVAAGRIELPSCGYEPQVLPLHYAAMMADLTAYIKYPMRRRALIRN